ncbi:uncharacterized protein LACBIDRAFT_328490 [Laccaria bicolor S238N-H82]|uniref:Predicted protein n=1 Tax=Laccaria bicolor (strain S238N-H82 / ATCC MYA-4686) TaxID=486041 RepID=B0DF01_LACBS|nr:uncharacterized protein LACBIDRAFT_328490 [Laccaria bicolor S238N-H82]EDR06634.1 predicted protein [Laccaria bicolor S238N-H82]|eukprot:XP_001882481.1 predicted protein [Laccaria bicolor S238N-H82]
MNGDSLLSLNFVLTNSTTGPPPPINYATHPRRGKQKPAASLTPLHGAVLSQQDGRADISPSKQDGRGDAQRGQQNPAADLTPSCPVFTNSAVLSQQDGWADVSPSKQDGRGDAQQDRLADTPNIIDIRHTGSPPYRQDRFPGSPNGPSTPRTPHPSPRRQQHNGSSPYQQDRLDDFGTTTLTRSFNSPFEPYNFPGTPDGPPTPRTPHSSPRKTRFYSVVVGRRCGVFESWAYVHALTSGIPGNCQRGFKTAEAALQDYHEAKRLGLVKHCYSVNALVELHAWTLRAQAVRKNVFNYSTSCGTDCQSSTWSLYNEERRLFAKISVHVIVVKHVDIFAILLKVQAVDHQLSITNGISLSDPDSYMFSLENLKTTTLHSHCLSDGLSSDPAISDGLSGQSIGSPSESIGNGWIPLLVQAKSSESLLKPLRSKKWLDWPDFVSIGRPLDFRWISDGQRQKPVILAKSSVCWTSAGLPRDFRWTSKQKSGV